jgi:threonyl-tRNA synthetase
MAPKEGGDVRPLEMNPPPSYFASRNAIFDRLKAEQDEARAKQPREPIEVTLGNGSKKEGTSWETSPSQIAREISKSLFERTVIARVDGELWDMDRPLEKSCSLELLDFDHPEGKKVFWHSSAHILGEACERRFGCSLCIGPPVEDGFYYEMALPEMAAVTAADWKPLKQIVDKVVKEKQPFERLELSKEDLLEMFSYNKYKQHIINDKITDGTRTTVYRCGPLIDLCRGPHVPNTGRIKAFEIMKNSASYFLGDANNDSLQRIYGVSFPDKKVSIRQFMRLHSADRILGARGTQTYARGGSEARSPKDWTGPGAFLLPPNVARFCIFPSTRYDHLQRHACVHPRGILEARLPGGPITQHVQLSAVEAIGSLAALQGRHVHLRG